MTTKDHKKPSAEKTVRDIRRATRRSYSTEEKIRIVLDGLRGEDSIAELCRREGINTNIYYRWSKEFLEAGKKRLAGDTVREATSDEVNAAVEKAEGAFAAYKAISYEQRAQFLEAIAEEIMNLGDALLERASGESGLPNGRFQGERGRTCNQLKMFASVLRDGSWLEINIDTAILDRAPIPKQDLRKIIV